MSALQDSIVEIKKSYGFAASEKFALTISQSEVYFDITIQHVTEQMKSFVMSGKMNVLQEMLKGGVESVKNNPLVTEMISTTASKYYGLDWHEEKKYQLAEFTSGYILEGLKVQFAKSGHNLDMKGLMAFAGLDGFMGNLAGGLIGKFGKFFK